MHDKLWITWERQRRSITLAEKFSSKIFMFDDVFNYRVVRYLILSVRTVKVLLLNKPKFVFCQNPSIVLTGLLCCTKDLLGFVLIVDRHSNFRFGEDKGIVDTVFHLLSDYTIRNADHTIVTNRHLCEVVNKKGGQGAVLEDKIPFLELAKHRILKGQISIVFVASFSRDEPMDEVISAFHGLEQCHLYITGNYKKHSKYVEVADKMTEYITFTGYLDETEYQSLLISADIIMVLTTREHTLTCGAYEGIALNKPLLLSDTEAIRSYFYKGVVYTQANDLEIRKNIMHCIKHLDQLREDIVSLRAELEIDWEKKYSIINKQIYG